MAEINFKTGSSNNRRCLCIQASR
ncbi:hypothetical protein [[Clostridium] symbiosum]